MAGEGVNATRAACRVEIGMLTIAGCFTPRGPSANDGTHHHFCLLLF
jgi:hypothetical protein